MNVRSIDSPRCRHGKNRLVARIVQLQKAHTGDPKAVRVLFESFPRANNHEDVAIALGAGKDSFSKVIEIIF